MSNTTYTPCLVDLSAVTLPSELAELGELIAKHVHDEWATTRIKDGWTFGAERDDNLKRHPCLVPYSELPESEREYDRNTATATLKLVMSMGYVITKWES